MFRGLSALSFFSSRGVALALKRSRRAAVIVTRMGLRRRIHQFVSCRGLTTRRSSRALCSLTVALGVAAAACSTSQFDGRVFREGEVAFRLSHLPPTWRRIEIKDTALAFRDDENAATIAINGRCGKDAEDVPLRALTQHLFLQFTDRRLEEQQLLALDGREALATQLVAKLDGVEKHFVVVVLKKDGCVYDFLQIAGHARDPEPFLQFVQGFSSLS
jgi:hypothetical protein